MAGNHVIQPQNWPVLPSDLARRWPTDAPLIMLHSSGQGPWARWSVLASPAGWYLHHGQSTVAGRLPAHLRAVPLTHDPLRDLDALLAATADESEDSTPLPCAGGWIGSLSYELGRVIEPAAGCAPRRAGESDWPRIALAWCPAVVAYDHAQGRWWSAGNPDSFDWIAGALERPAAATESPRIGPLTGEWSAGEHADTVRRVIEYIAAGDIFQANLTQRFTAPFAGHARAFAIDAMAQTGAWYGGLLELPDGRSVVSLSPELFLSVDAATRRVVTRPIKGTLPRDQDPQRLLDSAKDAAELHMIVDLMRNDLGRVCEYGTVRVAHDRCIETHAAVHQGVATVSGRVRSRTTAGDVLRATFPPGSITGAPKIRAMQIIEELESSPRGPYCGAIGCFDRRGNIALNVAIRTLTLAPDRHQASARGMMRGTLTWGAGGGIVADSTPDGEYAEVLAKTDVLRTIIHRAARACAEGRGSTQPLALP
jgi:para-aminobenzoate synthetase component 1